MLGSQGFSEGWQETEEKFKAEAMQEVTDSQSWTKRKNKAMKGIYCNQPAAKIHNQSWREAWNFAAWDFCELENNLSQRKLKKLSYCFFVF